MSPNLQQMVEKAIALNNSGAYYISNSDMTNAIRACSAALQIAKRMKPIVEKKHSNGANRYFMLDQLMMPMTSNYFPCKNESSTMNSQTAVYDHPIQLPLSATEIEEDRINAVFLALSAAVVFNLALCHHQAAMNFDSTDASRHSMHDATSQRIFLEKAVKLYESAYRIANKASDGFTNGHCSFFLAASLNNMAIIFQELSETPLAERCFHQLLTRFLHINKTIERGEQGMEAYHANKLEGFLRSAIMYVTFPHCSFPAAAA